MANNTDKPKDKWDKVDIVFKALGALMTPVIIAFVAIIGNSIIQNKQDIEMRTRLYSELMSKREEAESLLRKDMFRSIIESFLKSQSLSPEEKALNLELLAYNFHESLNLQPLFFHVSSEIISSNTLSDEMKKNLIDRLKNISIEIVRKQMLVLESSGKKFYGAIDLDIVEEKLENMPEEIEFPDGLEEKISYDGQLKILTFKGIMTEEEKHKLLELSQDRAFSDAVGQLYQRSQKLGLGEKIRMDPTGIEREETLILKGIERHFKASIEGVNFNTKELKVKLEITKLKNGKRDPSEDVNITDFWLGFFDFPMIDNTRLSDDQRCAVILTQFEEPNTKFTVVYFPGSRAGMKDKPYYDEVLDKLRKDIDETRKM
jgi:hypothetical protein